MGGISERVGPTVVLPTPGGNAMADDTGSPLDDADPLRDVLAAPEPLTLAT